MTGHMEKRNGNNAGEVDNVLFEFMNDGGLVKRVVKGQQNGQVVSIDRNWRRWQTGMKML